MSDIPEQLEMIMLPPGSSPPGENKRKKAPFVPPELPEGALGGFVGDRGNPEMYEPDNAIDPAWRRFWNPMSGKFDEAFQVRLDNAAGSTLVWLPVYRHKFGKQESLVHEFRLGDWLTVRRPITTLVGTVAKDFEVLRVDREPATFDIDLHLLGPIENIMAEGLIARGIDSQGRNILVRGGPLQKLFGRKIGGFRRTITVQPYDSLIGGTYYDLFDLAPPIDEAALKSAYRKKAMELHPDHNKAEDAGARFIELQEAYETLKDPAERAAYDAAIQLLASNFGTTTKQAEIMIGRQGDGWWPPINSGIMRGRGHMAGGSIVITDATEFKFVKKSGLTRVSAIVNGQPTLFWTPEDMTP